MFPWPTRDLVAQYTPQQFSKYPNTRVIIDCTELYIQRPSSLVSQSETFSNYKHHNTFKVWQASLLVELSHLYLSCGDEERLTKYDYCSKCGIMDLLESVQCDG